MRRTPRRVAAAMPVMVSDLGTAFARTGPVAARMVIRIAREIGRAVVHRTGQNVMSVGFVAAPVHAFAVLVQGGSKDNVGVEVKLIEIAGDQLTNCVVPGTGSDPAAGRYAALAFDLGAQIGAPCAAG